MDASTLVSRSKTPAVATDAEDRVVCLNDAARNLFGFADSKIIGLDFARVFQPRDIFGNPLGYRYSLIFQMLESGEPLKNFECQLRAASGRYQTTGVSVVVVLGPCPGKYELVHVLWPRDQRRQADEVIARLLNGSDYPEIQGIGAKLRSSNGKALLTARQQEILRLVAAGRSGTDVAQALNLSPETVRNHMRNILSRLGVHNRAEAVSVAYQRRLL